MTKLKVAVIGAGAAGLCAARYLAANPDQFEPVVFEKSGRIGGIWVYREETGIDEYGWPIQSAMYADLKTNLSKELMAFSDFPFDPDLPSFMDHTDVLSYLEKYAEHFDLHKYIKFHTKVDCVRPVTIDAELKPEWEVKVIDVRNREADPISATFDAVMVCNGRYNSPMKPDIAGMETFPGQTLHSQDYRYPSVFNGQSVLIIGANGSGLDIVLDLAPHAKEIFISHWKPRFTCPLPENITQVQPVKSVRGREVLLSDATKVVVDVIMFCTGYYYDYSFLHPDCGVDVTDMRVTPLYKHLIHSRFPTLSIIGIIKLIPFPSFSAQVRFVLATLDGSAKLPSREEMERDEKEEYESLLAKGIPHRFIHLFWQGQWDYNAELFDIAGVPKNERQKPVERKMLNDLLSTRQADIMNFKKQNFKIIDDETYVKI